MKLYMKIERRGKFDMVNAFCILFADSYKKSNDLQGLVRDRTLASLPVASRYRMVDFMLSSLVKAEVPNIAIVSNQNYKSLMDHVGWGKDWDLNRKNRGLKFITPLSNYLSTRVARNKIEALSNTMVYADSLLEEYCILVDSNIVGNIDFKEMLKYHLATNADITLAYTYRQPNIGESQIIFDENNRVYDSLYHFNGSNEICATQVKIYIMTKELFKEVVKKGLTLGWEDILLDYVAKNFHQLNVYAYEITGYSKTINTVKSYFEFNRDLLNRDKLNEVFLSGTDILTRVQDSVPTRYGEHSVVSNSLLGDGCVIKGTVKNSILFRDVVVEEGAIVKNSIIMQNGIINRNVHVNYIISDKLVEISEDMELKGAENNPIIIEKGKRV